MMWRPNGCLPLVTLLVLVAQGCASDASGPTIAVTPRSETRGSQPSTASPPVAAAPQYPPRFVIVERQGAEKGVDKYGYIDQTGRVVIPPQFDSAAEFSEGLALAEIGERRAIINTDGALAFRLPADAWEVGPFSEGMALVRIGGQGGAGAAGGKWGYLSREGSFAIAPRFVVRTQDVHKLLERGHFKEGLAPVPDTFGKWGYIDRSGAWVVRPQFDSAMPFRQGLGAVHVDPPGTAPSAEPAPEGKWGYVDRTGKVVWMFNPTPAAVPPKR